MYICDDTFFRVFGQAMVERRLSKTIEQCSPTAAALSARRGSSVSIASSKGENCGSQGSTNASLEKTEEPFADFTRPLDSILDLTQKIHRSKRQTSSDNMLEISRHVSEMKNKIINTVLPLLLAHAKKPEADEMPSHNTYQNAQMKSSSEKDKEWPSLPRLNRPQSSVIIKSDPQKKFVRSDARVIESKFNELLSNESIGGTIVSSGTTKNGDVMINFDRSDNLKDIASKAESNFGFKTRTRGSYLPKMTITRIPKYIHMDDCSPQETIVGSNEWLQAMLDSGETFEVLFSYEVGDWKNIVCRVSPKIRSDIVKRGNSIRIQNRSCRVFDRFHILQCGKCLEFGHKTKNCTKDTVSCKHCGEEGHLFSECPKKDSNDKLCCSNCKKTKSSTSVNHSSKSHSCPQYIKRLEQAIGMTKWGDGPIPSA